MTLQLNKLESQITIRSSFLATRLTEQVQYSSLLSEYSSKATNKDEENAYTVKVVRPLSDENYNTNKESFWDSRASFTNTFGSSKNNFETFIENEENSGYSQKTSRLFGSARLELARNRSLGLPRMKTRRKRNKHLSNSKLSSSKLSKDHSELRDAVTKISGEIKFEHLRENVYSYGKKQVSLTQRNDKIYARTGGGYISIKEFMNNQSKRK